MGWQKKLVHLNKLNSWFFTSKFEILDKKDLWLNNFFFLRLISKVLTNLPIIDKFANLWQISQYWQICHFLTIFSEILPNLPFFNKVFSNFAKFVKKCQFLTHLPIFGKFTNIYKFSNFFTNFPIFDKFANIANLPFFDKFANFLTNLPIFWQIYQFFDKFANFLTNLPIFSLQKIEILENRFMIE